MPDYLSTGIHQLDTLLGGGLIPGLTVVIRGQPGTGKTTLVLQIGRYVSQERGYHFSFVSVESQPQEALSRITKSLFGAELKQYLGTSGWDLIDLDAEFVEGLRLVAASVHPELAALPAAELRQNHLEKLRKLDLGVVLSKIWERKLPKSSTGNVLVVVDSLNALMYRAQSWFREYPERQLLLAVIQSFKDWRQTGPNATVIFTAEDTTSAESAAAESAVADTVIELRQEPRTYKLAIAPNQDEQWSEHLLFCRVTKGRGLHIQRRPCCYEFVERKPEDDPSIKGGITFFETYAAQGLVCLFHENEAQRQVIQTLREVDVPSSYPGVFVQEFSRPSLQRMFAVRRHQEQIPPRQPMVLSHVDEYWIEVLHQHDLLQPIPKNKLKLFGFEHEQHPNGSPIINELARGTKQQLWQDTDTFLAVPQMGNVGMLVYRSDLVKRTPTTWTELEEECGKLKAAGQPHEFLLETQTYDSLIATVLELGWSHGFFWSTKPRDDPKKMEIKILPGSSFSQFVDAMNMLYRWIHKDNSIVPRASTVDPEHFAGNPKDDNVDAKRHSGNNWAFARHWFTTWVDFRTRRDQNGRWLIPHAEDVKFDVAPIPISDEYRDRQLAPGPIPYEKHHSAAGEWYLAIQKGSENVELGINLINNLMTARKVTERALSGAELPVMQQFYKHYGSSICPHTYKSFDEIRQMFAVDARSRTEFHDFRKVARILNGPVSAIVTNPNLDVTKIRELLENAFQEIDPDIDKALLNA